MERRSTSTQATTAGSIVCERAQMCVRIRPKRLSARAARQWALTTEVGRAVVAPKRFVHVRVHQSVAGAANATSYAFSFRAPHCTTFVGLHVQ